MAEFRVNLYPSVLWLTFAFAVQMTGQVIENEYAKGFLFIVFILGVVAGGISFWNYCVYMYLTFSTMWRKTQSITPYSEVLEKVRWLSHEQISFLEKYVVAYIETPDDELSTTTINGIEIPDGWIRKFLLASEGNYLPPIRRFPEGSINRKFAEALTDHLISEGVARAATGNKSARIESWKEVSEAIGWR